MKDQQLYELTELLDEGDVEYWLNSGSLLGIVREGQLLESDTDIDIAIPRDAMSAFEHILPAITRTGYKYQPRRYRGVVIGYKLVPTDSDSLIVDVKIFREHEGHLWCPTFPGRFPDRDAHPAVQAIYAVSRFLSYRYIKLLRKFVLDKGIDRSSILARPAQIGCARCVWWYPRDLVLPPKRTDDGIMVPFDVEGFLEYRYGDWETPADKWNYALDDGGLRDRNPATLIETENG